MCWYVDCLSNRIGDVDFLMAIVWIINFGSLPLRLLISYIYGAPVLDVSRSHTTTDTVGRTPLDE